MRFCSSSFICSCKGWEGSLPGPGVTLLRATLKSPFLLKKTCHRLISLEEDFPYGKRTVRGELAFPTSLSSKVFCMWIKAHWKDARRHISTYCSSCQQNINHPCPTLSLFFSKTFVPALSTRPGVQPHIKKIRKKNKHPWRCV